jgi:hypothetical protein
VSLRARFVMRSGSECEFCGFFTVGMGTGRRQL